MFFVFFASQPYFRSKFDEKRPNDVFIIELNARIYVGILILTLNRKIWCPFLFQFSTIISIYIHTHKRMYRFFDKLDSFKQDLLTNKQIWFVDLLYCWPVMIVFNMVDWKCKFLCLQICWNSWTRTVWGYFDLCFLKKNYPFKLFIDFCDVGLCMMISYMLTVIPVWLILMYTFDLTQIPICYFHVLMSLSFISIIAPRNCFLL